MAYYLYVIELDKQVGKLKNLENKALVLFLGTGVFMLANQQKHFP